MALDENLRVNWPQEDGLYKVIQVKVGSKRYLRIGRDEDNGRVVQTRINGQDVLRTPNSPQMTRKILRDFLDEMKIPYEEIDLGCNNETMAPAPQGERHKLFGAGAVEISGKQAEFSGDRYDYDIPLDENHLMEEVAPRETSWKITYIGPIKRLTPPEPKK